MGLQAKTLVAIGVSTLVGLVTAWAVADAAAPGHRSAVTLAACAAMVCVSLGALLWLSRIARALERIQESARTLLAPAGRETDERPALTLLSQRADEIGDLGGALVDLSREFDSSIARLDADRHLYMAILDGMREGVVVTNGAGLVTLTNRSLRETLGLDRDPRGRQPIEVGHIAPLAEVLERAPREGPCAAEAEVTLPRRRTLLVSAAPLPDTHAGAVAVVHDITELRRLERVRRDFVANVSHELRTPITSVLAAAETLQGEAGKKPDEAGRFLASIHRNATRLAAIVEDLLRLSKIESGAWTYEIVDVPVRAMASRVVEMAAASAAARQVTTRIEIDDPALAVHADEAGLQLVLGNLLDNAIKYSQPGGQVRITAAPVGAGEVAIAVQDEGLGIEAGLLERVFERFYRVDRGRSRDAGGTGLGLSIVKNLVQGMGGEIRVESEIGRGSVFTVRLRQV